MTEPHGGTYVAERWTSLVTGVGPAVHGYCTWARYDTGPDGDHGVELDPAGVPRIWDVLSAAGRRVAVLDVPRQPPADVNGVFLFEWGTHDQTVGFETGPASLVEDLEARFGQHALEATRTERVRHVATCDVILWSGRGRRNNEQQRRLRELFERASRPKTQASEHLVASEPWDLFFTVFGEPHCATHQFWHLHEPSTPPRPRVARAPRRPRRRNVRCARRVDRTSPRARRPRRDDVRGPPHRHDCLAAGTSCSRRSSRASSMRTRWCGAASRRSKASAC